jgi:hypothetical protein
MSKERSEINGINDRVADDEAGMSKTFLYSLTSISLTFEADNEKEFDSTLECPPAPRIATIELPPDEDGNIISVPSDEGEGLPEALLFSDYGHIGPQK